jgi:hypothetical protein
MDNFVDICELKFELETDVAKCNLSCWLTWCIYICMEGTIGTELQEPYKTLKNKSPPEK